MANISKKITINAPLEKVYEFVTNPDNWTKYVTSLISVRDVTPVPIEAGTTFSWEYRMLGMTFGGKGRVTAKVQNAQFGMKMEGGFPIQEDYSFVAVDGGTELTIAISYETPGRILSTITKSDLVEKLNQKEAEGVLDKLKTLCEEL